MNTDDCDETCGEMCRANIINEDDLRNVANLMKIQIANLKRDRREKQAQENANPPATIADPTPINQPQQITGTQILSENQVIQSTQITLANQVVNPMQLSDVKTFESSDMQSATGIVAPTNSYIMPVSVQSSSGIPIIQNEISLSPMPTTVAIASSDTNSLVSSSSVPSVTKITNALEIPNSQIGTANTITTDLAAVSQPITPLNQNSNSMNPQVQQLNSAIASSTGQVKQDSLPATPTSNVNLSASITNVIPKRRTNKSTERCPKLVVLSITNNTLVECQMQNKQKTITFKFDIDDVNFAEIANNLVI